MHRKWYQPVCQPGVIELEQSKPVVFVCREKYCQVSISKVH